MHVKFGRKIPDRLGKMPENLGGATFSDSPCILLGKCICQLHVVYVLASTPDHHPMDSAVHTLLPNFGSTLLCLNILQVLQAAVHCLHAI